MRCCRWPATSPSLEKYFGFDVTLFQLAVPEQLHADLVTLADHQELHFGEIGRRKIQTSSSNSSCARAGILISRNRRRDAGSSSLFAKEETL